MPAGSESREARVPLWGVGLAAFVLLVTVGWCLQRGAADPSGPADPGVDTVNPAADAQRTSTPAPDRQRPASEELEDERARAGQVARSAQRVVERDLRSFAFVAANHDLEAEASFAVSQLLLEERRAIERTLSTLDDASALRARIEDIREDTDNDVTAHLSGNPLRAYAIMRQGRGNDVEQAERAAERE